MRTTIVTFACFLLLTGCSVFQNGGIAVPPPSQEVTHIGAYETGFRVTFEYIGLWEPLAPADFKEGISIAYQLLATLSDSTSLIDKAALLALLDEKLTEEGLEANQRVYLRTYAENVLLALEQQIEIPTEQLAWVKDFKLGVDTAIALYLPLEDSDE